MASAGQAQAHSSQPMHFSSPSGQRFSWWRPWKRGAVGFFSSGYWTVSTFRNICRKVTPKPFTGFRNSGTGDLLDGGLRRVVRIGRGTRAHRGRRRAPRTGRYANPVVVRQVQGWHGEPGSCGGSRGGHHGRTGRRGPARRSPPFWFRRRGRGGAA